MRRMSDADALAAYNSYRLAHPQLFVNPDNPAFELMTDDELQRKVGAGIMYQDAFSILLRDPVRFRDGAVRPYTRLIPAADHGGAAVLPVVSSRIVLLRHQRHATRTWHWEIPRGFAYPDEPPEQTARREIIEELGIQDPQLFLLGRIHPDTGATSVCTTLFLAQITGVGEIEAHEGIDEARQVTTAEFDTMVRDGEITDSFTLAAALQARLRNLLG
jgi:ADP-ribose pyrophosphatase